MKKNQIATIFLVGILTLSSITMTGCRDRKEKDMQTKSNQVTKTIQTKLGSYVTDLRDSSGASKTNEGIRKYLTTWAESKGLKYSTDMSGNVIIDVPANKKYKKAEPTVMICPYDSKQYDSYLYPMAMSLYAAKNKNISGRLSVIFTPENGHDFSGLKKLSASAIPDNANVFCLNAGDNGRFSLKTGGCAAFRFTEDIAYTEPEYEKAYKITMKDVKSGQAGPNMDYPSNPIIRFKDLLSKFKSWNIGYDLAKINGGNSPTLSPGSCSMTVVIDADREQKFIDKMTRATERFNEDRGKKHPGATYTFKRVRRPERVIERKYSDRFINFMYTLTNGDYYRNEHGEKVSSNRICRVRTLEDRLIINSTAYSTDSINLETIKKAEKTLCQLSNIHYKLISDYPIWSTTESNSMAKDVSQAYRIYTGKSLKYRDSITATTTSQIKRIKPDADVISLTVSENVLENCTGTLINYMIRENH